MPQTTIGRGNILYDFVVAPTLTPASVSASSTNEQTFAIPGLLSTDLVAGASSQSAQTAGIGVINVRVSAANTLAIQFANVTTTPASSVPVAGVYVVEIVRPETPGSLPVNAA